MQKIYKCEYDTRYKHCTNHHVLFVEAHNLAFARIEFDKDWIKDNDRWEEICRRKCPHRFHIEIHPFAKGTLADYVVSLLNNSMKDDAKYWAERSGWKLREDQIVDWMGFAVADHDGSPFYDYKIGDIYCESTKKAIHGQIFSKSFIINKALNTKSPEAMRKLIANIIEKC